MVHRLGCPPGRLACYFTLPVKGTVIARLSLSGSGLEARLITANSAVANRLNEARSELSGNLSANGLILMRLNMDTGLACAIRKRKMGTWLRGIPCSSVRRLPRRLPPQYRALGIALRPRLRQLKHCRCPRWAATGALLHKSGN